MLISLSKYVPFEIVAVLFSAYFGGHFVFTATLKVKLIPDFYTWAINLFYILTEGVHIYHNYCLWCVGHCYDLIDKGQGEIY